MGKYKFLRVEGSEFKKEPIFGEKNFHVYTDPEGDFHTPILYEITVGYKNLKYCLVDPLVVLDSERDIIKIKRYLLINDFLNTDPFISTTYFIGETDKCVEVSSQFTGQNVQIVTLEAIKQWYPKSVEEIEIIVIKRILRTQKYLGQHHSFIGIDDDFLFVNSRLSDSEKRDYKFYLFNTMVNEGLIRKVSGSFDLFLFVLTPKAISLVETEYKDSKTAFIALKFCKENTERIASIQEAIIEAGYDPIIMNQIETNNWIMPEIFEQIRKSKFVVVDFSIHCDGAYYEAGYAAGINKTVIHLFDKRTESDSNKLHFDIAQKSTIFYKDFDDLKNLLVNRISATVK